MHGPLPAQPRKDVGALEVVTRVPASRYIVTGAAAEEPGGAADDAEDIGTGVHDFLEGLDVPRVSRKRAR